MPAWPTTLPKPEVPGYKLQPEQAFLRQPVDAGPVRQRQRFTAVPTNVPFWVMLSLEQFETLEAWWFHEISQGAAWFDMTLLNGKGLVSCEARFNSPYEAELMGGTTWKVSGTLQVRSLPILTKAELAPRL